MIDTNVILLAGTMVKDVPNDQLKCYQKCIIFLNELMKQNDSVLVDAEGRVITEYKSHFRLIPYPNMADYFFRYAMSHSVFYHLEELSPNEYEYYPESPELRAFDAPDRKFIALAYGYGNNTPIVEAADSKWWGIREEIRKTGIELIFIDEEYIKMKWEMKMGK